MTAQKFNFRRLLQLKRDPPSRRAPKDPVFNDTKFRNVGTALLIKKKEFLIVNIRFDNLFYVKLNIIIVLVYLPKFTVECL